MSGPKLDFKIDPKVFTDLKAMQKRLPFEATGTYKQDAADAYDEPAGMALLGAKDGKLDTVVNLSMSGGCWDAPNINHKDFDKGFRKMIESDRVVVGMALYRHPDWRERDDDEDDHTHDAKMPTHLKYEIHKMKNAFADITKTAWIVLNNDYFRIYRPMKDETGRVKIAEMPGVRLFDEEAKNNKIIKEKFHFDEHKKEIAAQKRKEAEEERKRYLAAEKARQEAEAKREAARRERTKKKLEEVNRKLEEGKESVIDAGGGLSYVKGKDGKYILWQTGR